MQEYQKKEYQSDIDSSKSKSTAKSSAKSATQSTNKAESTDIDSTKSTKEDSPKAQKIIDGAYDLSLGISIVVAVLLGLGIGYVMWRVSGVLWLFWLGIFWGVAAAGLNIYKAYKRTKSELDALANDPRYSYDK
ncbi:AtpZ/AtpI family protein [Helicobacter sp. T3_23-1056]